MTPKELADNESKKLFEDKDVLFIKVLGYDAMDYYASETLTYNFNSFSRRGTIYLIIDKKGNDSYLLIEVNRGSNELYDFKGNNVNFGNIINKHKQIESLLVDFITPKTPYEMLLLIKSGKKVDRWDLKDVDECMVGIKFNEKSLGKSMIQLQFSEDEYIDLFEFEEGDWDSRILGTLFGRSYYGGNIDVFSSDMSWDEWKEGYMLSSFNNDNLKEIEDILSFLSPEIKKLKDKDQDKYYKNVVEFLDSNFRWFGENVDSEYYTLRNDAAGESIKSEAIKDLADVFQNYGVFRNKGVFTYYVSVVNILISLYKKIKNKEASILELFKELAKELKLKVGSYYEIAMEDWSFDGESFNKYVKEQIDRLKEEIEDNPEKFERFKEYGEVISKLNEMGYEVGKQYKLPADSSISFKIQEVRKDDSRIVLINWKDYKGTLRSYTFEEFVNYLNSPEIFENLIRKLKKIL